MALNYFFIFGLCQVNIQFGVHSYIIFFHVHFFTYNKLLWLVSLKSTWYIMYFMYNLLFFQVTISFSEELNLEQRPDDIDMQILRNVRRTASRSNTIMDDLKTLKAKVYGLENDLRHL